MTILYTFSANSINGEPVTLQSYSGKVLLIVNTASRCGFTPQYRGLEQLQQRFHQRGFSVLGFPCNQFGAQEPGSSEEISDFCRLNYQTSFPLFAKIEVNGDNAHPLYKHLTQAAPGLLGSQAIKWNFTKFLVDADGKVVKRYAPFTSPEAISKDIERLLSGYQAQ